MVDDILLMTCLLYTSKQVEQVEKQCFSVPWSEHILKDGLTGRFDTYLVWEKGGIIVGYCALRVLADEGEIQRIAVLPSWRRNGIAKSLMEAMIQVSKEKGAVQMSLEVRENILFFPMSDRFVLNCNFVQIVDPHTRICDLAIHLSLIHI